MTVRTLAVMAIGLFVLLLMIALMMSADLLLSVWERLREIGPWAPPAFSAVMVVFAGAAVLVGLRLLRGPPRPVEKAPEVVDAQSLAKRIEHASKRGVSTGQVNAELNRLNTRKELGAIYLAMFGSASSGKSSLISALLPDHQIPTDARLGTTTGINHYQGLRQDQSVQIADVPGFGHQPTQNLMDAARDEAVRAHLVIYVAAGDLDRDDGRELDHLVDYQKPIIVALNKADQYSAAELELLTTRLNQRYGDTVARVVSVSAGGQRQVIIMDGEQQRSELRARRPQVESLWKAIDQQLGSGKLELGREHSSLRLASAKLKVAEAAARTQAGQELTEKYARRAVIGALAAITPGSDLIIQAALATRFLRELGQLYEVPVKEIEIDRFLSLAGDRLKKTTALVLAVTGNACKAFPGVGTLTGGVIHAAAYGMIFDSLGKSICASLEERKALDPVWAAEQFSNNLEDSVEQRAMDYAKLALKSWRSGKSDSPKPASTTSPSPGTQHE